MQADAYLAQLMALLPPGVALSRDAAGPLARLLGVTAAELARVDGRAEQLLTEASPAATTELLPDWERALSLPDACAPNFRFSRASTAWYFDGAGVLRQAVVDEPRYQFDQAGARTPIIIVEPAGSNVATNPRFEGGVAGTPGTAPTGTTINGVGGWSHQILGFGTEDGIPYMDWRIWAPSGTGNVNNYRFNFVPLIDLLAGETWTGSIYHRLIAGDVAPFGPRIFVGGNAYVVPAPTTAPLRTQRVSGTRALAANVLGTFVAYALATPGPNGAGAGDVTIRIGLPQAERAGAATSPILPPAGSPGVSTRAADDLYIATTAERRARIVARLIERFEPRPASFVALAAALGDTVTITEFRPHDCEYDCEAAILDESWAHAFRVTGSASLAVESTCLDGCETPLTQWRSGAYECAMRRLAPAHTVPIFAYA